MMDTDGELIGAKCKDCEWSLTLSEAIEKIKSDRTGVQPSPRRVWRKFGSLSEGHAYFNRGHTTETILSKEQIASAMADTQAQDPNA